MAATIDSDVIEVLKSIECDGPTARLTCGQLDRKMYVRVNKVLEALGGKWNRSKKAHLFDEDAGPLIGDAVTTGEYVDAKKEFQFFETPDDVADILIDGHRFGSDDRVLEPSAGRGALIRSAERHGASPFTANAIELNPKLENDLAETGAAYKIGDFLEIVPERIELPFDAVVMNPPFTRSQDIRHVVHAYKFLRPGGLLFAVMASGWTFRSDRQAVEFREWTASISCHWEHLPEGAFRSSGTNVNAVIVRAKKPD